MTAFGTIGRNMTRTIARYRHIGAPQAVSAHLRAAALRRGQEPQPRPAPSRQERVVITLTTIPARASGIAPVLQSLRDQSEPADRIVLALPRLSRRTGLPYPSPETLRLPPEIDIIPCTDEGPSTKFLPALAAEPDAVIIVVDDDVIYPVDFIKTLLAAHRGDRSRALGLRGVNINPDIRFPHLPHVFCGALREAHDVDILFGTWGYLLPPHALDAAVKDFSSAPEALRWVDDVWISGHLSLIHI